MGKKQIKICMKPTTWRKELKQKRRRSRAGDERERKKREMQVRRRKKEKVMKIAGIEKKGRKGRAREKGEKK